MLMGHVGIFMEGSHGLGDVYSDWYQKTERDYTKVRFFSDPSCAMFCEVHYGVHQLKPYLELLLFDMLFCIRVAHI